MELAPNPILSPVGILNIGKKCDQVYTLSTGVWPGSYLTSSV